VTSKPGRSRNARDEPGGRPLTGQAAGGGVVTIMGGQMARSSWAAAQAAAT
jgi:hypothetical protein